MPICMHATQKKAKNTCIPEMVALGMGVKTNVKPQHKTEGGGGVGGASEVLPLQKKRGGQKKF